MKGKSKVRRRAVAPCPLVGTEGQTIRVGMPAGFATPDCLGPEKRTVGWLEPVGHRGRTEPARHALCMIGIRVVCIKQSKTRLWKPRTVAEALGCWFHVRGPGWHTGLH